MNISFPEHIFEITCLIVFKLHTTPLGGLFVHFGLYELDLLLVQNYDLFRRLDAHFVSASDLEKYWVDYSFIHIHVL